MAKILLIDSEEYVRLLYQEELNDVGHWVITMASPFELFEKIEEEKPDIIMLGVRLLDYSWSEVISDVREHYPDLPIIFSTSLTELWNKALMRGVTACFEKSSNLDRLKEIIDEIMAKRQK
jgi:DNA-binding NtrC family response regulator